MVVSDEVLRAEDLVDKTRAVIAHEDIWSKTMVSASSYHNNNVHALTSAIIRNMSPRWLRRSRHLPERSIQLPPVDNGIAVRSIEVEVVNEPVVRVALTSALDKAQQAGAIEDVEGYRGVAHGEAVLPDLDVGRGNLVKDVEVAGPELFPIGDDLAGGDAGCSCPRARGLGCR